MNRYIKRSLEPGEDIVYNGRLHWSYIFAYNAWSTILALGAIALAVYNLLRSESLPWLYYIALAMLVIALILWCAGRIVRTRSEFAVTATRFIQKDGILSVNMTEIPLYKVETVNYRQTFFQRIIGTGSIELVGSGGTSHSISHVESPMEVRRAIVSTLSKAPSADAPAPTSAPQTPAVSEPAEEPEEPA